MFPVSKLKKTRLQDLGGVPLEAVCCLWLTESYIAHQVLELSTCLVFFLFFFLIKATILVAQLNITKQGLNFPGGEECHHQKWLIVMFNCYCVGAVTVSLSEPGGPIGVQVCHVPGLNHWDSPKWTCRAVLLNIPIFDETWSLHCFLPWQSCYKENKQTNKN